MELGERMKFYEKIADHRFIPNLPVVVRVDGKNGSSGGYNVRIAQLIFYRTA